jgi:hypothetical protein
MGFFQLYPRKWMEILWMGQRNPAPVENGGLIGGKHPIFHRVSTNLLVVDIDTTHRTLGLQT